MGKKSSFIYILTNKYNKVLYVGVTNDLRRRVYEDKKYKSSSFTSKYRVDKLVYYEHFENIIEAIAREKQLKAGPRKKKIELINKLNPKWDDLFDEII